MKNKIIFLISLLLFIPNTYALSTSFNLVTSNDIGIACLCVIASILTRTKK